MRAMIHKQINGRHGDVPRVPLMGPVPDRLPQAAVVAAAGEVTQLGAVDALLVGLAVMLLPHGAPAPPVLNDAIYRGGGLDPINYSTASDVWAHFPRESFIRHLAYRGISLRKYMNENYGMPLTEPNPQQWFLARQALNVDENFLRWMRWQHPALVYEAEHHSDFMLGTFWIFSFAASRGLKV